jgi:hypothetical protein
VPVATSRLVDESIPEDSVAADRLVEGIEAADEAAEHAQR